MAEKPAARPRELPLEPIHRLLKAGIEEFVGDPKKAAEYRVGRDAAERCRDIVVRLVKLIGKLAISIVTSEGRKTIKDRDVDRAFSQIFVKGVS